MADERLSCPYNPHHSVKKTKMHTHLDKCFYTSGAKVEYAGCIFNIAHMLPKYDMDAHLMVCPDKLYQEENPQGQEDVVVCPYDRAHKVTKARLPYHLVKCRRNHPEIPMQVCFFNLDHHVLEIDYEKHLLVCPSKKEFEEKNREDADEEPMNLPKPSTPPRIHCDEDWDEEARLGGHKSYNPARYIADKLVIRSLPNATKSQRKAFREEEEERWASLKAAGRKEGEVWTPALSKNMPPQAKPKPNIPGLHYREPEKQASDESSDWTCSEDENDDAWSVVGNPNNSTASNRVRIQDYLESAKK